MGEFGLGDWNSLVGIIAGCIAIIAGIWAGIVWLKNVLSKQPPEQSSTAYPKVQANGDRKVIGRDSQLRDLRRKFRRWVGLRRGTIKVAIQADGGYGKSTLARYYIDTGATKFGRWINAADRQTAMADLALFAEQAYGMEPPETVTDLHIGRVKERIAADRQRLTFVFDNVDKFEDVRDLFPTGRKVDVLVTTRISQSIEGFQSVKLKVLDYGSPDGPAASLLLQEAGLLSPDDAKRQQAFELAKELQGLPLGLVVAGAMVREDGEDMGDLCSRIAEIAAEKREGQEYPTSVAGAVEISLEKVSDDARRLINIAAWWAPEGIEARLFTDAPGGDWWDLYKDVVPEADQALVADAARVRQGLTALRRRSLLTAGDGGDAMHRLTAAVLRAGQPEAGWEEAQVAAALLMAVYPGGAKSPEDPAHWPECRRLTPHAQLLWDHAEVLWRGAWGQLGWAAMDGLMNQCGVYLSKQERQEAELRVKTASLDLTEVRLGEEGRAIPLALGNLGLTLSQMGRFAEAEARLDRALVLDEAHRERPSDDLAAQYLRRAQLELRRAEAGETHDFVAAERWILAAKEQAEELGEAGLPTLSFVWNDLGYLRHLQGRAMDMADAYEQGLDLQRRVPGGNRANLAVRAVNAGVARLEAGQAKAARPLLREALDIREEIYAKVPGHGHRVNAALWLTTAHLKLGERAEAEALCRAYGFDLAEREARAAVLPDGPETD